MTTTQRTFAAQISRRITDAGSVVLPYRSDSTLVRALVSSGLIVIGEGYDGLQVFTRIGA